MTEAVATVESGANVNNGSLPDLEEMKKEAANLFIQGKRSLLIHDYKSAVSSLEDACRIFDQIYGVSADECGDAYLQYGIALMELARQETGVLDGVVSAEAEESSEESENGEEQQEDDEQKEGDEQKEDEAEANDEKAGEDKEQAQIAADEELAKSLAEEDIANETIGGAGPSCASSSVEPVAGSSTGATAAPEEEEEEAEPSSFECAWELLCLARDVFKRQIEYNGNESKVKLAEALQSLGEISIEWENNEAALDLLQESLSLRKEVLSADDRLIAETYYHIGIANSFMNEYERANDCFRSAMNVIEDRIKNLKELSDKLSEGDADRSRKEKEIKELESLLPEMAAKIEDSKDQAASTGQVMKQLDDEESKDSEVVAKIHDSPMKPVNNISHLVKRKREPETENGDVKKLCPANGSGDSAKTENGTAVS